MIIGVLIGIALIFGIISAVGGVVKKILEIISVGFRLCLGGAVTMIIVGLLEIEFSNQWKLLLVVVIGALVVFALIAILASMFRLVGYSMNYFTSSFLVAIVFAILGEKFPISFALYAVILFLFPRILWISDRLATTSDYSHTEYDAWNNVETFVYVVSPMDWWENSEDSWRLIPLQIVIASIFYAIGSVTMLSAYPVDATWLEILFVVLAIALNIVFDLFVLRKIEERFFD